MVNISFQQKVFQQILPSNGYLPVTDQELLQKAVKFQCDEDIFIEKRGNNLWCITLFGTVLDRNLCRHYEPLSSSRTDEFITATRFSLHDAFEIANRYMNDDRSK